MSAKYEYFGKFVLLDKVAAGGMAEVYRAKAPGAEGIGKILAIKRILPQYTTNHEFIEMFKSEAKIAINLTQANIAQIYEFGEEKNQFYLLMEYIDGRNLRQVLSRCTKLQKALTIEQCVYIIAQVANGLDCAHRCIDKSTGGPLNIIHRDMSPQNIMISFEGEVKIIDFGIAKAESKIENTRAGTLKGKFGYMSPEQAEGYDLDARTDIFSTGIVLWELLSGERLFIANNEVNTIRKIKECQIPSLRKINPNIHEELERISLKALAKDRNLRYQNSAELHRDLSRFLYKVNPEFTPHDLAVTVKSLFKDDILEDRKKSLEYARINVMPPRDEKTIATSDTTKTVTEGSDTATTRGEDANVEIPKSLIPDAKIKVDNIDFSAVKNSDVAKNFFQSQAAHSQITIMNQGTMTGSLSKSYRRQGSTGSRSRQARGSNSLLKMGPTILVVLGIVAAIYILAVNPRATVGAATKLLDQASGLGGKAMEEINTLLGLSETSRGSDYPMTTHEMTNASLHPPPMQPVLIHSIPAGAQIEVDGHFMGTTPLEVKLPITHSKVTISLKREGYLTYNRDYMATSQESDSITATLQKAMVGYVNIDVAPSFADIYVNGQRLAEKPPISRYPVPAEKSIVIKAINPYSNTFDQQVVTVKQDHVMDIKLFLHQSNRDPADNRY